MSSGAMMRVRRILAVPLILLGVLSTLASGGSGGGGGGTTPPPTNQALGGVWFGTDSDGFGIIAFSTESGRLHWVAESGAITNPLPLPPPIIPPGPQAFGTASVTGGAVTIDYTLVVPLGSTLLDGSTSAICSGTGTVQPSQTLTVSVDCMTSLGAAYSDSASLTYNSRLSIRESALTVVAGNYNGVNSVLTISGNGVIFEQDPVTGCVINGQVSIIDARFGVYDVSITYSLCAGSLDVLNGTTHTGLAMLTNGAPPEVFLTLLTGEVNGVTVSSDFLFVRI